MEHARYRQQCVGRKKGNKTAARDPTVFPAWQVLRMAMIEGVQAIGLGGEIGSLDRRRQASRPT